MQHFAIPTTPAILNTWEYDNMCLLIFLRGVCEAAPELAEFMDLSEDAYTKKGITVCNDINYIPFGKTGVTVSMAASTGSGRLYRKYTKEMLVYAESKLTLFNKTKNGQAMLIVYLEFILAEHTHHELLVKLVRVGIQWV